MSCAMGLVGVTDTSHTRFYAYETTAGTTRSAELRPELPAYMFPPPSPQNQAQQLSQKERNTRRNAGIFEQQRASTFRTDSETLEYDEFGDNDFEDQELMIAGKVSLLYCI